MYFQGRQQRPEYSRKWRQDHPGYYAAAVARWRAKNPERYLDSRRLLDAKRRSRGGRIEDVDHRAIYIRDKGVCYLCGRTPSAGSIEFDHVVPLSKGGDHTAANIKVACASCNASKGAKILRVAA